MKVYADSFFYNGKSSKYYNLHMVSFESSSLEKSNMVKKELSTAKPPKTDTWDYYGEESTEPIIFRVQLTRTDYNYLTMQECRQVARWLDVNNYKEFKFGNEDCYNILLYAKVTELTQLSVGNKIVGFEIEFTCNAPYGFSPIQDINISFHSNNPSYTLLNITDEFGFIYPKMMITFLENCDFQIINETENRITKIKNCKKNEKITLDNRTKQITSTNDLHKLNEDFNWGWFRFVSYTDMDKNILSCTNNCNINFTYQGIRKLGLE